MSARLARRSGCGAAVRARSPPRPSPHPPHPPPLLPDPALACPTSPAGAAVMQRLGTACYQWGYRSSGVVGSGASAPPCCRGPPRLCCRWRRFQLRGNAAAVVPLPLHSARRAHPAGRTKAWRAAAAANPGNGGLAQAPRPGVAVAPPPPARVVTMHSCGWAERAGREARHGAQPQSQWKVACH